MSNPNDPKPTPPDQPDPTKGGATPPAGERPRSGGSSYDFQMDGSYSDLPPVPTPDAPDPNAPQAASLPPRPTTMRPSSGSFDFIDLGDIDPAMLPGSSVRPLPPAPPPVARAAGDSSVAFALPVPTVPPSSFTLGGQPVAALPVADPPSSVATVPDIATLFPPPPVPAADAALADLELPTADPDSFVMGALPHVPAPTPDLESVLGTGAVTDPIEPASGWLGQSSAKRPAEGAAPAARPSSYEFTLPPGVTTYSDIPPVTVPDPEDPNAATAAEVPPSPEVRKHTGASFEFGLDDGLPEAEALPLSDAKLNAPLLTLTAGVMHLPDPAAAVGNLEPVDPVAPASGWLDADVVLPAGAAPLVPTAEPAAGPFGAAPAGAPEGSDIFSGERPAPALPVEHSDVIAATAYGSATPFDAGRPSDPPRTSDVALHFDRPLTGSTVHDGASDDLPVADELADSGTHPIGPADATFDSARLAGTPDLPGVGPDDATDFGTAPAYSADASSILADLSEPDLAVGDSSSVRVEAPGVGRTLTGGPASDAFDLTVSDEPVPADLFDAEATDATDWQAQSGSDLFAEGRTAPEIDFDANRAGTVEPVDAALTGDQPSLSSSPSSIFSGTKLSGASGSGPSGGSADLHAAAPDPSGEFTEVDFADADLDLGDAAEFTDHPTVERPTAPVKPALRASSGDFELPAEAPPAPGAPADDAGAVDWDAASILAADDDNATRGMPKEASLSDLMRGLGDDSSESPTRGAQPVARIDDDGEGDGKPVVTVDWMSASGEGSAVSGVLPEEAKTAPARPKDRKAPEKPKADDRGKKKAGKPEPVAAVPAAKSARPAAKQPAAGEHESRSRESRSLLVGALLGGVLAGGAWAGVYFGGAIPNSDKTPTAQNPTQTPPNNGGSGTGNPNANPNAAPAAAGPQDAFKAGDTAAAVKAIKDKLPATPDEKAAAGYVRVYAKVQELGKSGAATAPADDADLKAAREDLKAVRDDADAAKSAEGLKRAITATVNLGVSYELAGDRAAARKVYTDGRAKFPESATVFDSLLDRLDTLDIAEKAGPGASFRAPRLTPDEAQRVLLAVSVLLADDKPAADDPEPGAAYWKAVKLAKAGNYADAVKFIGEAKAAHVKRAKALAGRGLNPLTDPLEEMFPSSCDQLAAAWKTQMDLYGHPALGAALKAAPAKTLDALAKDRADLVTAKKDLVTAKDDAGKLEKEVTAAKEEAAKLDKDLKAAATDLKAAQAETKAAQADAKEKADLIAAIAVELKPAKVLPEKWGPADLVAGVKVAAGLAGGADAQRVVKAETAAKVAEAAAKVAADKLVTETKALNAKYDTDTAKLRAENATEIKKVVESSAADAKKLADKYAADAKKLTDDHAAALAKLKTDSEVAVKAEQAKTEAEKKTAALKDIAFQKQLANAVTPAQAVDIWLPVLTDLRRVSDAAPAMAVAARALESALPESEDAAKAHTVNGMALLLKGSYTAARDEFQLARKGPAYAAAKGKAWAKAADAGLDAIDDPLALYRQPVVIPPIDVKAAAKALDAGIAAYKDGRYDAAAAALTAAAKNDPADPVAWYFLGAVRLALGDAKQADKDIGQGAAREKVSPHPARGVSEALAPVQGAARDAIDKARP